MICEQPWQDFGKEDCMNIQLELELQCSNFAQIESFLQTRAHVQLVPDVQMSRFLNPTNEAPLKFLIPTRSGRLPSLQQCVIRRKLVGVQKQNLNQTFPMVLRMKLKPFERHHRLPEKLFHRSCHLQNTQIQNPTKPSAAYELVNLVTALVPSETACFASSPGKTNLTAVWISREVMVGFLLYLASLEAS
uniref:Uncharacterized protein n=1 Tax=Populus trichocarpa TaxID=3694 RepID=A0A2K1YYY7_POPTR